MPARARGALDAFAAEQGLRIAARHLENECGAKIEASNAVITTFLRDGRTWREITYATCRTLLAKIARGDEA